MGIPVKCLGEGWYRQKVKVKDENGQFSMITWYYGPNTEVIKSKHKLHNLVCHKTPT